MSREIVWEAWSDIAREAKIYRRAISEAPPNRSQRPLKASGRRVVHVTFIGALRAHLNKEFEEIEVPEEFTIGDFIRALSAKHGDIVEYHLLDANRRFRSNVVILVDGVRLDLAKGIDRPLTGSKRTEVVVMEAVGGG